MFLFAPLRRRLRREGEPVRADPGEREVDIGEHRSVCRIHPFLKIETSRVKTEENKRMSLCVGIGRSWVPRKPGRIPVGKRKGGRKKQREGGMLGGRRKKLSTAARIVVRVRSVLSILWFYDGLVIPRGISLSAKTLLVFVFLLSSSSSWTKRFSVGSQR